MKKKGKTNEIKPIIKSVEKDAYENTVENITTAKVSRYRMVPVDVPTYKRLRLLCEARGFGQRGQGALVRILVNKAFEDFENEVANENIEKQIQKTSSLSLSSELKKLADLKNKGILTDKEFQTAKKRLIGQ
jgi:hypothetical protein